MSTFAPPTEKSRTYDHEPKANLALGFGFSFSSVVDVSSLSAVFLVLGFILILF